MSYSEKNTKCSSCDGQGRVADPDHNRGQKCETCGGSGVTHRSPGLNNGKCFSCNGDGVVQCPQHGMSQRCESCGGSGLIRHSVCEVHQCHRPAMLDRKICENHAFPAARPKETTGRRAAVLATRKKIEEAKVSAKDAEGCE